ncbi:unnamed protein product [Ceratitis capitata]|uniref:(Mediterranean fruit fly) hypothetical protein n=1 Tax=Ceratitis capitata TaxID=7213 RepID=A0A811U7U5_CERCA|nr:unnamed protein product [Ceratitis capitata]
MRAFIVLALIAAARADVGGYNYGAAVGSFPLGGHGGSNGAAHLSAPIGGGNAGNLGGPASNGGVGDFGSPLSAPVAAAAPAGPEFQKEFFTYQAPDAEFDDDKPLGDLSSENRYLCLQKQSDVSDLAQKLQNLNVQNTNKPEVHFVKYRTPEDAAHAQHAIQQQYNDLGGDSVSHDGGLAPVLNFASQSPAAPAAPSNAYIPPAAPASLPAPAAPAAPVAQSNTYIPPAAPSNTYIPPASQPEAPSNAYLPILKF